MARFPGQHIPRASSTGRIEDLVVWSPKKTFSCQEKRDQSGYLTGYPVGLNVGLLEQQTSDPAREDNISNSRFLQLGGDIVSELND